MRDMFNRPYFEFKTPGTHNLFNGFLQSLKVSDIPNMVMCHSCRSQPYNIAHFDFILPESQWSPGDANKDLYFSAVMDMYQKRTGFVLFETVIQRFPVSTCFRERLINRNRSKLFS